MRLSALLFVVVLSLPGYSLQDKGTPPALDPEAKAFVDAFCLKCHSA